MPANISTQLIPTPPPRPLKTGGMRGFFIILQQVIFILIGSYGLSASLHIILRAWVPEGSMVISFFSTFAHLMWMPALVLLPLMLLARQWQVSITLILPVVMFLSTYGLSFLPRQPITRASNNQTIRIQTHNLLAHNRTPQRIPEIITDISADIVALQEVSHDFEPMLEQLDAYPYKAIHVQDAQGDAPDKRVTMGQAVLSKYPILEDDYWFFEYLPYPLAHQRVVLDVDGQSIVLYNVHPTHPGMTGKGFFNTEYRRREIQDLLERIQSETLPIIMLGDFNMTDLNYEYQLLTQQLTDTYREVGYGMGFTFPDFKEASVKDSVAVLSRILSDDIVLPLLLRLDYVFHNEAWVSLSARVYPSSGGSDHRPIVVELALR